MGKCLKWGEGGGGGGGGEGGSGGECTVLLLGVTMGKGRVLCWSREEG